MIRISPARIEGTGLRQACSTPTQLSGRSQSSSSSRATSGVLVREGCCGRFLAHGHCTACGMSRAAVAASPVSAGRYGSRSNS